LLIGAVVIYVLPDTIVIPPWSASSPQPADSAIKPDATEPASVTQVVPVQPQVASGAGAAPGRSAAVPSALDAAVVPAGAIGAGSAVGGAASVVEGLQPTSVAPVAPVAQIEPRLQSSVGLTPPPATAVPQASAGSGALSIAVTQSTWIDVRDGQGRKLLSRLAQPGENLSLDGPAPLRVRIGNVAGTQVRYQGQPVDLAAFARNNVARIELK
jgi:cytoskeleton protein RodZ